MKNLTTLEKHMVSGAGVWDDFWETVGEALGQFVAESAYSQHSKNMHNMATNGELNNFLTNQSDPLL